MQWLKHLAKKAHLGTSKASLPSVVVSAPDKEAFFAECILAHSTKGLAKRHTGAPFAEFQLAADSIELAVGVHWSLLCRVLGQQALGKGSLFVECHWGHSAKSPSSSLVAVTVTFLC